MKLIIDAMSGDFAPVEIVKGALAASKDLSRRDDISLVLVGDEARILACMKNEGVECPENITIVHTEEVLTMEDDPMCVRSAKKDSSMAVGLKMLADGEGDAFVSTGNTGALFTGATLIVRKVKGVLRAGIATVLPMQEALPHCFLFHLQYF